MVVGGKHETLLGHHCNEPIAFLRFEKGQRLFAARLIYQRSLTVKIYVSSLVKAPFNRQKIIIIFLASGRT